MGRPKQFDEKQILERAVYLFWQKGYNATSIQDLVSHLGINRASLYDTFGGKQALYQSALQQYRKEGLFMINGLMEGDQSVEETVAQLLETTLEEISEPDGRKGCFVVNTAVELAPHDTEIDEIVQIHTDAFVDSFADYFRKGQAKGEVPAEKDPVALARYLYNTLNGLRVLAKTRPDRAFLTDIIKTSLYVITH